jgi:HSP20 family protein
MASYGLLGSTGYEPQSATPGRFKEYPMALLARRDRQSETQSQMRRQRPQSLRDEIDRVFDEFFPSPWSMMRSPSMGIREFTPTVDLSEANDAITVTAELPGMNEDDIHVDLDEEMLTISGERRDEKEDEGEGGGRRYREISYGSFRRDIVLPYRIDADKVKASFKNGMLKITLPKSPEEAARRRSIQIGRG